MTLLIVNVCAFANRTAKLHMFSSSSTTASSSAAYYGRRMEPPFRITGLKNHMCVLGWISRSHARNGNEIQTSGRHGSTGNIEKLGFLIPINPKNAWKSGNLAWCHEMAPTCCGNFVVRFAKAHTLTINKVILEQVMSRYNRKHKYYWNRGRSTYQLRAATRPLFLMARRCRAG